MDHTTNLSAAIDSLSLIDRAGLLGQLENELAFTPQPDRFAADPFFQVGVDRLARAASRILGEPLWKCRRAANAALTPTRQQQALILIAQFSKRLSPKESGVVEWS